MFKLKVVSDITVFQNKLLWTAVYALEEDVVNSVVNVRVAAVVADSRYNVVAVVVAVVASAADSVSHC